MATAQLWGHCQRVAGRIQCHGQMVLVLSLAALLLLALLLLALLLSPRPIWTRKGCLAQAVDGQKQHPSLQPLLYLVLLLRRPV